MVTKWEPSLGDETEAFLGHACPEASRDFIRDEALQILGKAVSPIEGDGNETGLVIGYVQSGKTLSFETVLTLAHDNKFPIVVVLAGTSNPLLNQSTNRIRKDLRLDEPNRELNWVQVTNPSNSASNRQHVQSALDTWSGSLPPGIKPRTLLITLLKYPSRINDLIKLARACNISTQPILVLDDEADQASMNAQVNLEEQSRTYESILGIKKFFDNITFLQYTATPQAPLLISIIDALSPNFVHVLPTGEGYVGGKEFFADNTQSLITIPDNEVPSKQNHLDEPPHSLTHALMTYLVGATIRVGAGETTSHISMLVHPSHLQNIHKQYCGWVSAIIASWKSIIKEDSGSDYDELVTDFKTIYQQLKATIAEPIPSFTNISQWFSFVLNELHIEEMNASSGKTPEIPWTTSKFWILVGGQALDRGYTVEGLTVTYMPRSPGVGNADTIQQRARFFGYKNSYFGYCRVYLSNDTIHAFKSYVSHEEDIRQQMLDVQDSGQPLDEWKRSFILDPALRPTRATVIEGFSRVKLRGWITPKRPICRQNLHKSNQETVTSFITGQSFIPNIGHEARALGQKHGVCSVLLEEVMNTLVGNITYEDLETKTAHSMLLVHLRNLLDSNPNELCTVYHIAPGVSRTRELKSDLQIDQLFQGANPESKDYKRGEVYKGDRELIDSDQITIQIHQLELKYNSVVKAKNVPVIAVWLPNRLSTSVVYQ